MRVCENRKGRDALRDRIVSQSFFFAFSGFDFSRLCWIDAAHDADY